MNPRLLGLVTVLCATSALAAEGMLARRERAVGPFDRTFGIGAYATGWAGAYGGAGVGGRVRIEVLDWLGIDLFGGALLVTSPAGVRHDHPIGCQPLRPHPPGQRGAGRDTPRIEPGALSPSCILLALTP